VQGALLKIEGLSVDTTREDIKETLTAIDGVEIGFAEFETGQTEGIIRFKKAEDVASVLAAFTGEKKIKDSVPKFSKIDGEEEKQYYEKLQASRNKGRGRGRGGRGRGRGRGRGGRGGKRGGRKGRD